MAVLVLLPEGVAAARGGGGASGFFSVSQKRIFQLRVIDNSTGKKFAIGSGFAVSADGLIATNYHVVSDAVIEPGRFRLEYVAGDGRTGPVRVLDVDVVHDLALVASDRESDDFFRLGAVSPEKGNPIFSMGNPLDLGMTIIEGTYSGLIEESLYEKIIFSGSLNPGMSGGPTIDASGSVIGINVSTAGNEISFLVPELYLRNLLSTVRQRKSGDTVHFLARIEQELYDNQERYMHLLLAGEWKQDTLGDCLVPREMGDFFRCWGETPHDTDLLYSTSYVTCSNSDDIFLSSDFSTGDIDINYRWYETTALGRERFYRVLQRQFAETDVPNADAKDELREPQSVTRFVAIAGARWKTTLCSWQYRKYPRLHDVVLKMALVNKPSRSMIVELRLLGVSRESALSFCKKFMGALRCRN
jgi:hypothetical protein